jgi:hypothetical protein
MGRTRRFGKKSKSKKIMFQLVNKFDRETFFQSLSSQGWEQIGNPFEFDRKGNAEKIRALAMEYAQRIDADMLIEVEDEQFSTNPYNNQVFYAWKMSDTLKAQSTIQQPQPQPQTQDLYQVSPAQLAQYYSPAYQPATQPRDKQVTYSYTTDTETTQQPIYSQMYPAPQAAEVRAEAELALRSQYYNYEEALDDCVEKLAMLLMKEDKPFKFIDTKELLHPKVTIKRHAYFHVGTRPMDLVLVQVGVNEYTLLGNEAHRGTAAMGSTSMRRDELISIKTLGRASFMPLPDFKELSAEQKSAIANALFMFLSRYLPVV